MMEINSAFTEFITNIKDKKFSDYKKYFYSRDDLFEFEVGAFREFIQNHDLLTDDIEFFGKNKEFAKLKYKYIDSSDSTEKSNPGSWFVMRRSEKIWKVSSKREYLKYLAESNKWRKIIKENITFYYDSFLKKTLDNINAENCNLELVNIFKYMGINENIKVDYYVFDDSKSLFELGLNSNFSGSNWVVSNDPSDIFQLVSLVIKRLNPELPKYLMYGFSAYYAYYISTSSFPIFNFPKDDFDNFAFNHIKYGYYIKITKLINNKEFLKWNEMVSIMSILSKQKFHPTIMVFLISASFVKFLINHEVVGENGGIRKDKVVEALRTLKESDFEYIFKKIIGIKLKKAEKLWKKDLNKRIKNR